MNVKQYYLALLALNHMLVDLGYEDKERKQMLNLFYNYTYIMSDFDNDIVYELAALIQKDCSKYRNEDDGILETATLDCIRYKFNIDKNNKVKTLALEKC